MIWGHDSGTDRLDCYGLSVAGRETSRIAHQFLIADLKRTAAVSAGDQRSGGLEESDSREAQLMMVAGGVGGAGERRASRIAVEVVTERVFASLERDRSETERDVLHELADALHVCQERLWEEAAGAPQFQGMGTTITACYLAWPRLSIVHVGDSRCYLLRDGRLRQLTTDHTFAQRMVEQGVLNPERAEGSQWARVLWNVVGGGSDELAPEMRETELMPGDAVLLCTHGLCRCVPPRALGRVLADHSTAESACRGLAALARTAGGEESFSAVVGRLGWGEAGREESRFGGMWADP